MPSATVLRSGWGVLRLPELAGGGHPRPTAFVPGVRVTRHASVPLDPFALDLPRIILPGRGMRLSTVPGRVGMGGFSTRWSIAAGRRVPRSRRVVRTSRLPVAGLVAQRHRADDTAQLLWNPSACDGRRSRFAMAYLDRARCPLGWCRAPAGRCRWGNIASQTP